MPEEAAETVWPFVRRLKKPVMAHGEERMQLELREPHTGDMLKYGVLDGTLDGNRTADLIAELSGINPAAVKSLHPSDFFAMQKEIMGFFTQAAG